ncbi:MAG: dihydroorotate dehydrogenase electron transfer subunit [Janthinobacterium lividum]
MSVSSSNAPIVTIGSHRCRVVAHSSVNPRYRYIQLESTSSTPPVAAPGQFYQLKCPITLEFAPFLLRPMSVYAVDPESRRIAFLYNVTGTGTRALASLKVGEEMDIVGPLGNTFTFDPAYARILLVARGVGLATMASLARQAARAGVAVTAIMSARSRADLMEEAFLGGIEADVHVVLDEDRSSAVETVEALVRELVERQCPDAVYTCGSQRLLMALQRQLRDRPDIVAEVAMEQRMACGMGVCLSCVRLFDCDGTKEFLRVCREGPVFRIRDVVGEVEFG